ncbi:MAG: hypothetical protein M3P51_00130 [Chloroflexota bacterium]|nr:hypothetical protein [Chloroflexota bacterium]
MKLVLVPGRPALILAAVLGAILALVPLAALAAGSGANDWIEACRTFIGSLTGLMPCTAGR